MNPDREKLKGQRGRLVRATPFSGGRSEVQGTVAAGTEVEVVAVGATQLGIKILGEGPIALTLWVHDFALDMTPDPKPLSPDPVSFVLLVGSGLQVDTSGRVLIDVTFGAMELSNGQFKVCPISLPAGDPSINSWSALGYSLEETVLAAQYKMLSDLAEWRRPS